MTRKDVGTLMIIIPVAAFVLAVPICFVLVGDWAWAGGTVLAYAWWAVASYFVGFYD